MLLRYRHLGIITKGSLISAGAILTYTLNPHGQRPVAHDQPHQPDDYQAHPRAAHGSAQGGLRAIRVMREAIRGVLCRADDPDEYDSESESLLAEAHAAGAQSAAYMMLRCCRRRLVRGMAGGALPAARGLRDEPGARCAAARCMTAGSVRMRARPFADLLAQCLPRRSSAWASIVGKALISDCTAFCPPGRQMVLL